MKMDYNIAQRDYLGILHRAVGVFIFVQAPEAVSDSKSFVPINWIRILLYFFLDMFAQIQHSSWHLAYLITPTCGT